MIPHGRAIRIDVSIAKLVMVCILSCICSPSTLAVDQTTAESIVRWDFGAEDDVKRDRWPDGWTRTRGIQFPNFIPIAIEQRNIDPNEAARIDRLRRLAAQLSLAWEQKRFPWQVIPESIPRWVDRWLEQTIVNPYLSVQMDGGAAEVLSPLVSVDAYSVYVLEVAIHSEPSEFYANAVLRFLDRNQNLLFEMTSPSVDGTHEWKTVGTELQYPDNNDVAYVQVVLKVSPKSSKAYKGKFAFDRVRIWRYPRLRLFVDHPMRIYRSGDPVQITCMASGMQNDRSSLLLRVFDHNGKEVTKANKEFSRTDSNRDRTKEYFEGRCDWVLQDLPPGYYDVRTKLTQEASAISELNQQFVVLYPLTREPVDPRFGWTLDQSVHRLDTKQLMEVLNDARVGRVKIPIWFDYRDALAQESYLRLIDRIQTSGINCVGIIASPPKSLSDRIASKDGSTATVSTLEDPVLLNALLDPVFRQLCVRISDFQIGWDHEVDFAGNPRFATSIDALRKVIHRYGPDAQLVAARNPLSDSFSKLMVDRWQLSNDTEFASSEWVTRDPSIAAQPMAKLPPWTSITPIEANRFPLSARVQDLAGRMIAVTKENGAQRTTAWIQRPFDKGIGVLSDDGGPQEMYIPFRTMADQLSGLKWIGSMELPNKSVNHLIGSDSRHRLILWSTRSTPDTIEQVALGEEITARDIWGREVKTAKVATPYGTEHRIPVSRWPVIVDRVDPMITRWRMGISINKHRLDSIVGKEQEVVVRFENPFPFPISGRIELVSNELFGERGFGSSFEVDANSQTEIPISVVLKPDASTKNSAVRVVAKIGGQTPYQFSLFKELNIGSGDVEIDVQYHFEANNQLSLDLEAINRSGAPVSFECTLFLADRRPERIQIVNIKERVSQSILIPRATSLIGQTVWLRCEQIGSGRVLNYRVPIESPTEDLNQP